MREALKSGFVSLVRRTGLAVPIRNKTGGCGVILCLHEIQEDPVSELMTGSQPSSLAGIIDSLRNEGWEIVGLDEAVCRMDRGQTAPPFAVLTFDDGYRDTLRHALPILEKRRAPFTVYVPTGAVTRELYAWWLALRALLRSREEVTIDCMAVRFPCASLAEKLAALRAVGRWVREDYRREHELAPTFEAYGISLEALADTYFFNEDELKRFARHPLVTIGAHTSSHAPLATLQPGQARAEMADNKSFLERLTDRHVAHLAYPYGDRRSCGPREAVMAEEIGFTSAVTTEPSPVFPKHHETPHALPRISVTPAETLTSLYYAASGFSWALKAPRRYFANA